MSLFPFLPHHLFPSLSHSLLRTYTHSHTHTYIYTTDPLDIDDGLYNFLSPQLISNVDISRDLNGVDKNSLRPHLNSQMPDKPEWFQKGYKLLSFYSFLHFHFPNLPLLFFILNLFCLSFTHLYIYALLFYNS